MVHGPIKFECRNCGKEGQVIGGVCHLMHRCCSQKCYVYAGKYVRPVPLTFHGPFLPKKSKGRRSTKVGPRKKGKKSPSRRRKGYDAFFDSQQWLELRYQVLKLYGRTCMLCGETKGAIQVDHIKPRSKFPELALNFDNLQVLCRPCNFGKSNKDFTDFRVRKDTQPQKPQEVSLLLNRYYNR